jgi:hypothetical protein
MNDNRETGNLIEIKEKKQQAVWMDNELPLHVCVWEGGVRG